MELTMVMKCCLLLVVSCALLTTPVTARPSHRQKRVSDQRLAELETLLALARMKNRKFVTVPVGYGLIDVHQIGRRKRSEPLEIGHQDASSSDYDQADVQHAFSSADSDSVKEEQFLGRNYSDDEESSEVEESGKDRTGYMLAGLRHGPRAALFLGMRGQQQHPRFI
ncbi:uncharacterized protein LOC135202566 [Macrobrachium nipponense]|uniref:uncharacterized protein LOC135202566 n=1 Tax=Macrobrachium nipponense TaxID=159736 RepID=UPI0030C83172